MRRALVFGGYGVFGGHVAVELARRGVAVTVVGRDNASARRASASLPPVDAGAHAGAAADLRDPRSFAPLLDGNVVAVHCAGPFGALGFPLVDACAAARVPYVDIADDRAYLAALADRSSEIARAGAIAVAGCSSLPGISGALALLLVEKSPLAPTRARVTLFIGNDNPKGLAAVRSAVSALGRPVAAPQGTLRGFGDRDVVTLPAPFGRRAVYTFDTAEYDLFPSLLGVRDVAVKVGFELRAATAGFALLAHLGSHWGDRTARVLDALGGLGRGVGHSGGVVQTELWLGDEPRPRVASLSSAIGGQRMAALPCALVAARLCDEAAEASLPRGVLHAWDVVGARGLVDTIVASGYELSVSDGSS